MSIDECVINDHPECLRPWLNIIPYFCGNSNLCMTRNETALHYAKLNVKNKYVAVGLVEDMESSLRLFENLLPDYFSNSTQFYESMKLELHEYSKTARKIGEQRGCSDQNLVGPGRSGHICSFDIFVPKFFSEPEPETMKILRDRLKNEIELYDYVQDLFYLKLASLSANEI